MSKPTPKYLQAVTLAREGHTIWQIAALLQTTKHGAHSLLRSARLRGIDIRPHISVALLTQMTPEVRAWLDRQTPEGATVGDAILAVVADAYQRGQK